MKNLKSDVFFVGGAETRFSIFYHMTENTSIFFCAGNKPSLAF
ncbi:MAG: hypothetical protein PUA83_01255 [Clostridiales bacterium]|nr:hypothetical protein [Clostridiales bacterium]